MTEKELYKAFDFQRFEKNGKLEEAIGAAHRRAGVRELSSDELELVSAAGEPPQHPVNNLKEPSR